MTGILIIAHAPLATALRDCAAHIFGGLPPVRVGVIDVQANHDPAAVLAQARAALQKEAEMLVLTDMYGATPANIAKQLATVPNVRVLAGVNLPMLVRAVCYQRQQMPLDVLADKASAGAINGIQEIAAAMPPVS